MILLVDKPEGISSFDVIRRLRKELNITKMGHAGTLDPRASGLLIIATDEDTKKLTNYIGLSKVYEVTIRLGEKRDTGDLDGEIIEEKQVESFAETQIQTEVKNMIGIHMLPVPKYSAVKVSGRPLYKYAREGKEVEVPIKKMEVLEATYVRSAKKEGRFDIEVIFHVSSGSYIRALVEEFGKRLGCPATTARLRRIQIGEHSVEGAKKIPPR